METSVTIKNLLRERELRTHEVPEIRACPYIRQLQDVIGAENEPKKLVLEWMDTDLWKSRPYNKLANPKLPQVVAKSILEALVVFQRLHAVHTGENSKIIAITPVVLIIVDVNPNNILVSNIAQMTPIVKFGDLDNGKPSDGTIVCVTHQACKHFRRAQQRTTHTHKLTRQELQRYGKASEYGTHLTYGLWV
jgi:serine/threonine protein kinase